MKKSLRVVVIFAISAAWPQVMHGVQRTWNNTGTNFNDAASWAGGVPGPGDVAVFNAGPAMQPNLSASVSIAGLYFFGSNVAQYDITATNSANLTLTGTSPSGLGGTSDISAAAIRSDNTAFINTIDAPLVLAPSTGTQSTFVQADGGALVINGAISSAPGINLSLRGGVIQLNGANSHATTSIDGSVSSTSTISVLLGNDGAVGNGTLTINTAAKLTAAGGARSISNPVVFGGDTTLIGQNAFTFTGNVTSSGSSGRTLTVSNTGGATFNGTMSLEEAGAPAGRRLTIDGTAPVVINGVVQDGDVTAASLRYNGGNRITLNNTNTYTGGTVLTGAGNMLVTKDGGLGSGNVTLSENTTLTLQSGVTNNYIADTATLSLQSSTQVFLNYSGADTINMLAIDGTNQAAGTWGAPGSGATHTSSIFGGIGMVNVLVVPEPASCVLIGLGALMCARQLRRNNNI
jgi:hypothetical protein